MLKSGSSTKTDLIKNLALTILGKESLEKALCYFASYPTFRKNLKIGVIPLAYTYILDKPEIRKAKIGKYQIYVNIAEYSGVSLYFFGEHNEPFSAWLVSEFLKPGDTCIDIGANVGTYTFLMADRVGSQGRVFAFEPNPDLYHLLLESVKLNNISQFVAVERKAVYSQSDQELKFYISVNPSNTGTSSLIDHGVFLDASKYTLVETITLSDYFKEKNIDRCHLLKIDVERAELDVLQGMSDLLQESRIDYIILEQLAGGEPQQLLDSFHYQGWLIDETNRMLVDIAQVEEGQFANYLFVSPGVINDFTYRYASLLKAESK